MQHTINQLFLIGNKNELDALLDDMAEDHDDEDEAVEIEQTTCRRKRKVPGIIMIHVHY